MDALIEKTEKFWEEINKVRENYKKIDELVKENRGSPLMLPLIFKCSNLEEELDRLDEEKKNRAITNQKHKEELDNL